jgi:hypothetical protein
VGLRFHPKVEIVEPDAPVIHPEASAQVASTLDKDIVVVGTAKNESRLPHMRQHCQEHKLVPGVHFPTGPLLGNHTVCDLCFYYDTICVRQAILRLL